MTDANLNITVDSSSAAQAAGDLDALAMAAPRAGAAVREATASMTAAMRQSANDVETLASRINRALNIRPQGGQGGALFDVASAQESAEAMIAEMDRLRARFDPLFAASQRFLGVQREINDAYRVGALTRQQATEALERERQAVDRYVASARAAGQIPQLLSAGINQRLNVQHPGAFVGDAQESAEAMGASMDALRAKFNPLFAVEMQHKAAIDEINFAHRVGALSVDEMTAALKRQEATTNMLMATEKERLTQGIGAKNPSQRGNDQTRYMSTNLMYQMQDIAVTAAMGMPLPMIALQQGMQAGAIMTMMQDVQGKGQGTMGVLRALGPALASVFSGTNLVAIGLTAASAAAIQFFTSSTEQAKTLSEQFADNRKALDDLAKAYERAGMKAVEFDEKSKTQAESAIRLTIRDQEEQYKKLVEGFRSNAWYEDLLTFGMVGTQPDEVVAQQFTQFQAPIATLRKEMAAGVPDFEKFNRAVMEIANEGDGSLKKLVDGAARWVGLDPDATSETADQLLKLTGPIEQAWRAILKLNDAADQYKGIRRPERGDREAMLEAERLANQFQADQLSQVYRMDRQADVQRRNLMARTMQERVDAARYEAEQDIRPGESADTRRHRAAIAAMEEQDRILKSMVDSERERQISRDEGLASINTELDIVGKSAIEQARRRKELELTQPILREAAELDVAPDEDALRRAREYAGVWAQAQEEIASAQRAFDRGQDRDRSMRDAQFELDMLGKTGAAAMAARKEYELAEEVREDYRKSGLDQTDAGRRAMEEELAAIREMAGAWGEVQESIARKSQEQELAFEKSIAWLSEEDQAIARRQHAAGLNVDLNSRDAQMERELNQIRRMKEAWEEVNDVIRDAADTLTDALFDVGTDWEETFKKIGRDFARMIFEMAVTNPLKNWLTGSTLNTIGDLGIFGSGAATGRTGQAGGLIGSLFGIGGSALGGAGGAAGSSKFPPAPEIRINPANAGTYGLNPANYVPGGMFGPNQIVDALAGGAGSNVLSGFSGTDIVGRTAARTGGLPLAEFFVNGKSVKVDARYVGNFKGLFADLQKAGYPITSVGEGGYSDRFVAGTRHLSQHAYGQAVDINPRDNPYSFSRQENFSEYGVDPNALAKKWGLEWGGNWRKSDAMHFQVPRGGGRAMAFGGEESVSRASKALEDMTDVTARASDALSKAGLAGFETVKGLTDATGGLTKFGSALSSFMGPGGGSSAGWFQGLSSMFGGASGAINRMMGISPGATAAILSGTGGLYHTGGTVGYAHQSRMVDLRDWIGAPRFHFGGIVGLDYARGERPIIAKAGEPIYQSHSHARAMLGMNDNAPLLRELISTVRAQKMTARVGVYTDPNMVGKFMEGYDGEESFATTARRTGTARSL